MKKLLLGCLFLITVCCLAACNNDKNNVANVSPPSSTVNSENSSELGTIPTDVESSDVLIAYFTMPETDGTDTVSGASRVIVDEEILGNTQYIAQVIKQATDGELFPIQTLEEYPSIHDSLVEFAENEKSENARPELSSHIDNMQDYEVVFIGFPNWWADMPVPLYTFFDEYDLSGKTIIPFSTHGGSGFSNTISTIVDLEPDATVIQEGYTVSRNSIVDAEKDVISWTENLGL